VDIVQMKKGARVDKNTISKVLKGLGFKSKVIRYNGKVKRAFNLKLKH